MSDPWLSACHHSSRDQICYENLWSRIEYEAYTLHITREFNHRAQWFISLIHWYYIHYTRRIIVVYIYHEHQYTYISVIYTINKMFLLWFISHCNLFPGIQLAHTCIYILVHSLVQNKLVWIQFYDISVRRKWTTFANAFAGKGFAFRFNLHRFSESSVWLLVYYRNIESIEGQATGEKVGSLKFNAM